MPPNSHRLVEEGAAIVAFKLVREGRFQVPYMRCFSCDHLYCVLLGTNPR